VDLFPTILKLADAPLPTDRVIDGVDMSPILFENEMVCNFKNQKCIKAFDSFSIFCVILQSQRDYYIYYPPGASPDTGVFAIRYKEYKAHYYTSG